MRSSRRTFCLALVFAFVGCQLAVAQAGDFYMYFGTYTGFKFVSHSATIGVGESHSKGIYVSRFHAATGKRASRSWPLRSRILRFWPFTPIIDFCIRFRKIRSPWGRRSITRPT